VHGREIGLINYIKAIRAKYFPDPNATKHVVKAELPRAEDSNRFRSTGLRRGMWVVLSQSGEVGIASEIGKNPATNEDYILFQRTHPETGVNLVAEFVAPGLLRQARYNEIPPSRRPANAEWAARLGYR